MSVLATSTPAPSTLLPSGASGRPRSRPISLTIELTVPGDGAAEFLDGLRHLVDRVTGVSVVPSPRLTALPGYSSPDPQSPVRRLVTGRPVRLYPALRAVRRGHDEIPLTRREFDLLLFLAENPRRVFGRGQLLRHVWESESTGVRTVDVHVRRLRQKLGEQTPLLSTVRGVGYRLHDQANLVIVRS